MKNILIRCVILTAVFIISFSVISRIINKGNTNMTSDMEPCTFPSITVLYGEKDINQLYGYDGQMLANHMRDTITPLDSQGKLTIRINTYGNAITGIGYEVRSLDTSRLVEDSTVKEWDTTKTVIDVKLNIQDLLEDKTEYILIIKLSTSENEQICYYTRITKDLELYTQEKLDFIKDFHDKTFQKEEGKDLVKYLESNSSGDNTNFNYVNINSSYDQVTWGKLDVEQSKEPVIQIQELNNQTGVFVLRYQLKIVNDSGETEHYNIEEFYRIRYTKDRMYLLDFERTMEQVFEEDNDVYYSNTIQLGIADKQISYMENDDGSIVSFIKAGELFSYNKTENKISKLFGFMEHEDDVREQYGAHNIKIIKVDENGDTDFLVYGYMNRGKHEGKSGVSVCRYDSKTNSVEEYIFITSQKPYQLLQEEVGQLAYIGNKGILYIHMKGNIYAIHTDTKQADIIVENVREGTFAVSDDNQYVAWQKEQAEYESSTVILMNLETGEQKEITAGADERIRPVGFMGSDFIYGLAKTDAVRTDGTGKIIFPMYRMIIQNEQGEVVKQYEPSGFYVTDAEIYDNMIRLSRVTDNDRNGNYVQADEDQIVNSSEKEQQGITVASTVTEKKKREYQLNMGSALKSGSPKRLYPKEILTGESNELELAQTQQAQSYYYVYAKGKLDSMYVNATEAIAKATDISGVVVTENQNCIWEKTKSLTKTQIMDVETVTAADGISSAAACVSALLKRNTITVDAAAMLQQGYPVRTLLEEQLGKDNVVNLTGTSLDNALYSISKGYPVLAMTDSQNYVIIVGYNELNTIVMNPQTGKTGYVGMNDSKAMFESAGNVFLAITK